MVENHSEDDHDHLSWDTRAPHLEALLFSFSCWVISRFHHASVSSRNADRSHEISHRSIPSQKRKISLSLNRLFRNAYRCVGFSDRRIVTNNLILSKRHVGTNPNFCTSKY
mmetsp:Transcript_11233/g.25498  ORF Transcript_11233/g.25498 Transcript_11233/m.25498 type:complete len:111 (+) Transcript_11233:589-921(+)